MIRTITVACGALGVLLAVCDFFGWIPVLEKHAQFLKKYVGLVAEVVAPQRKLPSQERRIEKFNQRIHPYNVVFFFVLMTGFVALLLIIWGRYAVPDGLGWGTSIALWLYFLVLALIFGFLLALTAIAVVVLAIVLCIIACALFLKMLAIPRRGILGTLGVIVTIASFLLDRFSG